MIFFHFYGDNVQSFTIYHGQEGIYYGFKAFNIIYSGHKRDLTRRTLNEKFPHFSAASAFLFTNLSFSSTFFAKLSE